jgi:hypothetical protein
LRLLPKSWRVRSPRSAGRWRNRPAIAQKAVEKADRTNTTVQGLYDGAASIGDVVKLINDIASQTNLLALNATIEAARAGEAGRGFAVVASEVKSLAEQTAKATEQIGAQITAIQNSSSDAVTAIRGITSTISEMNEIASAIASAVEEQGSATQEIARNVQQAALGTGEISANVVGVQQAAGDTGAAAHQVLQASSELVATVRDDAGRGRNLPQQHQGRLIPAMFRAPAQRSTASGTAGSVYFLTQITRTTDAFASVDPPVTFTPLAFRKSRTGVGCRQHRLRRGYAIGRARDLDRLQQRDAGKPAVAILRGRAGKAERGRGRQRDIAARRQAGATEALTPVTAAPPPWFCGSAMPVRSSAVLAAALARLSALSPRAP